MPNIHTYIIEPKKNIKIWRYIDFTKFVSLLKTKQLYFTRSDQFDDTFEGSWPKKYIEQRKASFTSNTPEGQRHVERAEKAMVEDNKKLRSLHAISCWHMNEKENPIMWEIYLKDFQGVAIQSTYERLKKSLKHSGNIYIGEVDYIDFETYEFPSNSTLIPFLHKKNYYFYEKELRAIYTNLPIRERKDPNHVLLSDLDLGILIDVDLPTLIEDIYIAPKAPEWFHNLVKSVVKCAVKEYGYNYNFTIKQPDLNKKPFY